MSTQRWLALAAALGVLFLASVAAGAFVARMGSPSGQPVANASPTSTPSPAVSSAPTTSPTLLLTNHPTPSPSPEPATPTPSPAPTATPSVTPSAPPATQPPMDAASAQQFAADLAEAIRGGDDDFVVAHLHPATIDRYGIQACRRYVRRVVSGDDINWDVHGATGPNSWDYVTDGLTTTIDDAWTISVTQAGATPPEREVHFAPDDGSWRWFTDCGNPR